MSKEAVSSSRLNSRTSHTELDENEFGSSMNPLHFPPPRTPLHAIPDPSQYRKEIHESELNKTNRPEKGSVMEASGSVGQTPRVSSSRHGKVQSEPNSAQSTPARSSSRVSLGGGRGVSCPSASFSRVSRGIAVADAECTSEVPQFELVEDPLFWDDHNVQVCLLVMLQLSRFCFQNCDC